MHWIYPDLNSVLSKKFHFLWNGPTEEAGRAQFNLATATYATVAYSAVWFVNKTHLKWLQEGFNVEPQRIFGLNNFSHNIAVIFEFSYLYKICKITCKPMGNFAENLNLGNRVLPPLPINLLTYFNVDASRPVFFKKFKGSRTGHFVKVSRWYASLLTQH